MENNQEIELKLRLVDSGSNQTIIDDPVLLDMRPGEARTVDYETTYYDTPDHRLARAHYSYRIRKAGEEYTATVKEAVPDSGGLFQRREWERNLADGTPDLQVFADQPDGLKLAEITGGEPLMAIFSTNFQRTAVEVTAEDGSMIEMAVDTGEIISGNQKEAFCEIELELKSGQPVALLKLAALISERYPLILEEKSKFLRGLILSGLTPAEASPKFKFNKNKPWQDEYQKMLLFCLQDIISAQTLFLKLPEDVEAVHQLRVKIRQLRSLLSFIKPLLYEVEYLAAQEGLNNIIRPSAEIRQADVLLEEWRAVCLHHPELLKDQIALRRILRAERARAQSGFYRQIAAGMTTPILLRLWVWLLEPFWTPGSPADLDRFIVRRTKNWLGKVETGLKNMDVIEQKDLHALRIQCKKLRYLLDGLAPVMKKRYNRLLPDFKILQAKLGTVCDAQSEIAVLQKLMAKSRSKSLPFECGILIGWQINAADQLLAELAAFELI